MVKRDQLMCIAGEETAAHDGSTFEVENPATGETIFEVARGGKRDVEAAIEAARSAADGGRWPEMHPRERGRVLRGAADLLRVLTVQVFADEDEAVALSNDASFGLGAALWTRDLVRAHTVAQRIRAGTVWINDTTASIPRPHGADSRTRASDPRTESSLTTTTQHNRASS
jgi:acyl-CoA reductase-like NAD-dependent aldehyde dehydrogenase